MIVIDEKSEREQNYFFITSTKSRMSSCRIKFNRGMSGADWGPIFAPNDDDDYDERWFSFTYDDDYDEGGLSYL